MQRLHLLLILVLQRSFRCADIISQASKRMRKRTLAFWFVCLLIRCSGCRFSLLSVWLMIGLIVPALSSVYWRYGYRMLEVVGSKRYGCMKTELIELIVTRQEPRRSVASSILVVLWRIGTESRQQCTRRYSSMLELRRMSHLTYIRKSQRMHHEVSFCTKRNNPTQPNNAYFNWGKSFCMSAYPSRTKTRGQSLPWQS